MAPWKVASDDQVLRMDIPQLDVEGACVSIIGNLGQSLGFLVFWSLAGYEAFGAAAQAPRRRTGRLDLGTDFLALGFERVADLPTSMRREAMAHGWPIAQADAYPRVERRERDGVSRPLVERDLKIATACAASLSTFFTKHRKRFEADDVEPVCESYFDKDDLEVRFTLPYEAFPLFEVNTGPRPEQPPTGRVGRARVGRNDPCPCGSGRKYKKCHLPLDEQEDVASRVHDTHHDLDERLVGKLREFARSRFGVAWGGFAADFVDSAEALQLSSPWSVYHYGIDGMSVLDRYLEEQGRHLPRAERAWLAAQQAAWLSVWEVTQVEPGSSVALRDLLSDETRLVREVSGSQTLVVRDALLGRVADYDGASLLCGVHPRPLPPLDAAEVVRRARGRLLRKRAVPVERLRDEPFGRYLIKRWEETVAEADVRWKTPPDLRNTDGDPILLTTDHFEIGPGMRPAVEAKLAALEGVEPQIQPRTRQSTSFFVRATPYTRAGKPRRPVRPGLSTRPLDSRRIPVRGRTRYASVSRPLAETGSATGHGSTQTPSRTRRRSRNATRQSSLSQMKRSSLRSSSSDATTRIGSTIRFQPWPARRPAKPPGRQRDGPSSMFCSRTWRTASNARLGTHPSTSRCFGQHCDSNRRPSHPPSNVRSLRCVRGRPSGCSDYRVGARLVDRQGSG